jgi:FtsP/CotA-like multicopper oxidase with cupredoxin domain
MQRYRREKSMNKRRFLISMSLVWVVVVAWSFGLALAQNKNTTYDKMLKHHGKVTPAETKAAAKRAAALGLQPGVAAIGVAALDPGGVPHYFGPYGNWAYSPLPRGPVAVITLTSGGTGYNAPVVTIDDVYGTGSGAIATVDPATQIDSITGAITGITFSGGTGYSAPIVTITDATGIDAAATATIGGPFDVGSGIRKFIDKVPGLYPAGANLLGQYIPVAVADTTTYPGSDYYEIALVEYNETMHSDLPPTRHRGYVQLATLVVPGAIPLVQPDGTPIFMPDGVTQAIGVDNPHFLGPVIVARGSVPGQTGVPVRIKFYNLLPTGAGGDLFIPVDTTVMGSGMGPMMGEMYTQNRGTIHLHGNNTVWISDGTAHQWITPAGETTSYPKGVNAVNVPDMLDPGPGAMTFYYTNAQSARLMFYHDHSYGITRLNVYAGEAAAYVMTDQVDQDLINGTNVSGVNIAGSTTPFAKVLPDIGIPLVIVDRTFVDATTIAAQDPTWNWGTTPPIPNTGDLWYPHVYMSAQNPYDLSGTNAFGRWHYGPWFWPPTTNIDQGPVPNPYCLPQPPTTCTPITDAFDCSSAPWEPPCMPGTPNPSMPGEAFMDTPVVNGTAYPYMEVEPKAYRFRILNAADDRMLNLQLYVAADKTSPTTPGTIGTVLCDGISGTLVENCTEVKMVPAAGFPNQLADWPSGLPDPATKGPDWIQIGTEGGFLPAPVAIPSQPIGWNLNPTTFNYGNVNQHSLLLGTAERADVVVDFSAYAGKTLILYNDAPAAFPAGVPTYDYYTGTPDQMDTGGAPTTQPGYGPNTRTVMQIRVTLPLTTPTTDVTLANLNAVFAKTAEKRGVFEASQDPIIMPQAVYQSAYNVTNFPSTAASQYVQFFEVGKTFRPIDETGALLPFVTLPLEPKAMHDEMGGVYDTQFGRMSGMLGLDNPNPTSTAANFLAYGYASPPVDIFKGSVFGTPIGSLPDGTQIWKITHNGVDSHTIHTHLFNSQLINRVAMDGIMLPPDPNELGWKDTFRVNPLEHTILAMRPIFPTPAQIPFQVPNSIRLIDPTMPEGAPLTPPPPAGWFDPAGNPIAEILNHYVNFGWEYMWHCHILAHEEMDMMHSMAVAVPPDAPSLLAAVLAGNGKNKRAVLTWVDNSLNETSFTIQRATNDAFTGALTTFTVGPNVTTYSNTIGNTNQTYYYRVFANNTVGDTGTPGFPTETVNSAFSNTAGVNLPPAAPSNVVVACARFNNNSDRCTVTWADNSNNETGFRIQRANDSLFTIGLTTNTVNTNVTTYTTGNVPRGATYYFRVQAYNASGVSAYVAAPSPVITP